MKNISVTTYKVDEQFKPQFWWLVPKSTQIQSKQQLLFLQNLYPIRSALSNSATKGILHIYNSYISSQPTEGIMNITNFFSVFYPLSADDTEYGYHSASSSSAEHHAAQLGPVQHPQQQHQQQQNYIQGQNQSHVSTYRIFFTALVGKIWVNCCF